MSKKNTDTPITKYIKNEPLPHRWDGRNYEDFSRANSSVESGGTKPIDISLMTGNGQTKEGEKK